jgi:hypothetical protein
MTANFSLKMSDEKSHNLREVDWHFIAQILFVTYSVLRVKITLNVLTIQLKGSQSSRERKQTSVSQVN